MSNTSDAEETLPLAEERVSVQKRTVATGRVRVKTIVDENEHWVRECLEHEDVRVTRVHIDREIENYGADTRGGVGVSHAIVI